MNSPGHPARPGSIVAIWATGTGLTPVSAPPNYGRIAAAAQDLDCCQANAPGPLYVLYGGFAPGIVTRVMQANFQVPDLATNFVQTLSVFITAHDRSSGSVQIYVAR